MKSLSQPQCKLTEFSLLKHLDSLEAINLLELEIIRLLSNGCKRNYIIKKIK